MPNGNGNGLKRTNPDTPELSSSQKAAAQLLAQANPCLTQAEVAEQVGVRRQTISTWLNDNPTFAAEVDRIRLENYHKGRAGFGLPAWVELTRIVLDPNVPNRDKIAAIRVGFEDLRNAGNVHVVTNVTQTTTNELKAKSTQELQRLLGERKTALNRLGKELETCNDPDRN